jgi:hypothetical protein
MFKIVRVARLANIIRTIALLNGSFFNRIEKLGKSTILLARQAVNIAATVIETPALIPEFEI